ncbi:uncharacterized protein LOC141609313 [Silene latifolia]|uniref:uncharacterized protein LOC141609313 n=1 Tax=Silene latifolia TaxID=37657 RepID=UPI003D77E144
MDYMSVILNLGEYLVMEDDGFDDDELVKWIMSMGEPSFYSIQLIKDRGNSLFKDGNLPLATSLYKLALTFFGFLTTPDTQVQSAASSLALSLVLNLAACELKLSHFKEVRCLCNIILNFDPCNVKALFRRGSALKRLNLFEEALDDFKYALHLEPKNKDVAREFKSVSECLLLNPNGKRVSCHLDPLGRDKKGKKHLFDADMDNMFASHVVSDASCSSMESLNNATSCDQVVSTSSLDMFMDSSSVSEPPSPLPFQGDHIPSLPFAPGNMKCSFSNKRQAHKKMYLSCIDYENMKLGRNLEFYYPKYGAYMKVRPLFSQSSALSGIPHDDPPWESAVPFYPSLPKKTLSSSGH